jgi:hypothetical protein
MLHYIRCTGFTFLLKRMHFSERKSNPLVLGEEEYRDFYAAKALLPEYQKGKYKHLKPMVGAKENVPGYGTLKWYGCQEAETIRA